jgi:hypothetical protein
MVQNGSTMVYCMTETNPCPSGPEIWECSTNKGCAAALPLYSSAGCPVVGQMVLAFMTCGDGIAPLYGLKFSLSLSQRYAGLHLPACPLGPILAQHLELDGGL